MELLTIVAKELGTTPSTLMGSAGGGAVSSVLCKQCAFLGRVMLGGASAIIAWQLTPLFVWFLDVPEKLDGPVAASLGIFGASIALRLLETIQQLDLLGILGSWFGGLFKKGKDKDG